MIKIDTKSFVFGTVVSFSIVLCLGLTQLEINNAESTIIKEEGTFKKLTTQELLLVNKDNIDVGRFTVVNDDRVVFQMYDKNKNYYLEFMVQPETNHPLVRIAGGDNFKTMDRENPKSKFVLIYSNLFSTNLYMQHNYGNEVMFSTDSILFKRSDNILLDINTDTCHFGETDPINLGSGISLFDKMGNLGRRMVIDEKFNK